jgi:hypothetical protein
VHSSSGRTLSAGLALGGRFQSTVKLITEAIAQLKADPKIGRAEALRRLMLSLITTGKDYEALWATSCSSAKAEPRVRLQCP